MPVSPLPPATYPELSREAASNNWNNFRQILKQGSRLAGSYTSVAVLFLVIFGKPLIARLYGAEYLPAYPALVILMVGFLVANTFYWNRIALLSVGLPEFPMKVNSILAVFKVIGIVFFVPMYGYLASAVLLTGYYVSSVTAAVIKLRSVLKLRDSPIEA